MIRHVVLLQLNSGATAEKIAVIASELAAIDFPGRIGFTMGSDLGLRPGNMDVAIEADFASREAYAAYDVYPEHDRIRRELIAPITQRIERCQYEI